MGTELTRDKLSPVKPWGPLGAAVLPEAGGEVGVGHCHRHLPARGAPPAGAREAPRPHRPPCPQVQQLERSIGLKDLAMAELEQKVHEMEATTFDGVFVWKISDFARKRQEAVAGRTPAIFSPGAGLESASELLRSETPAPPREGEGAGGCLRRASPRLPPLRWVFKAGAASGCWERGPLLCLGHGAPQPSRGRRAPTCPGPLHRPDPL